MKEYLEKLCKKYDPERDISGRAGGDYGHHLADMLLFEREVEDHEKENELERKSNFVQKADKMQLNPDSTFDNTLDKLILMEEYGFINLKSLGKKYKDGNRGDPLVESSRAKLGKSFKNIYYSFKKQLGK